MSNNLFTPFDWVKVAEERAEERGAEQAKAKYYAPNGMEWKQSNVTEGAFIFTRYGNVWLAVPYGDGNKYSSDSHVYVSPNGATWNVIGDIVAYTETVQSVTISSWIVAGVHCMDGKFYIIFSYNNSDSIILTVSPFTANRPLTKANTCPFLTKTFEVNGMLFGCGAFSSNIADIYRMTQGQIGFTQISNLTACIANNVSSFRHLKFVAYGRGRYVMATSAGLYYSTNGTSWTVTNKANANWIAVAYGNGKFVAMGSQGLFYSSDGVNWSPGYATSALVGCALEFTGKRFLAAVPLAGSDGTKLAFMKSIDGSTTWSRDASLIETTRGTYTDITVATANNGVALITTSGADSIMLENQSGSFVPVKGLANRTLYSANFCHGLDGWVFSGIPVEGEPDGIWYSTSSYIKE